jgi:hypothetical protein
VGILGSGWFVRFSWRPPAPEGGLGSKSALSIDYQGILHRVHNKSIDNQGILHRVHNRSIDYQWILHRVHNRSIDFNGFCTVCIIDRLISMDFAPCA